MATRRPSYARVLQWMVDVHMAYRREYRREWLEDMLTTQSSVQVVAVAFGKRVSTVVRDVMALWTKQGGL